MEANLERFAAVLDGWRDELTTGRGFLVLRGAPVERWDLNRQKLT